MKIRNQSFQAFALASLPVLVARVLILSLSGIAASGASEQGARMFPLTSVRLADGPFRDAVAANREYLLAHDPDRLLAPFLREAGLRPKAPPYGNWESGGLDGHTAGHYLSALAFMVASGSDTPDGELRRRLEQMLDELARVQQAHGDGYIGGVPGSRDFWKSVAAGDRRLDVNNFGLNGKWVPWYNVHKTFAGLRDAYAVAGYEQARQILVRLGDWCVALVADLSDDQMQHMLRAEHGGMNEVMADLFAITGNQEYLDVAGRFHHRTVLDPLMAQEDRLTGLHANTQIPKVIGLQRIAALTNDDRAHAAARFFWETVTQRRSVAFGGNSVSEHFNDPRDFRPVVEHREGPETCNTYNMLRLTQQLFAANPHARYADYYERALFNHILAAIHPHEPGYVYFTPLRPDHYRVYSQPEHAFWCCVGTGMENPGKYGSFIYARAEDGVYVNLFLASTLTVSDDFTLHQETAFPDQPRTRLRLELTNPKTFTLHLRHPGWAGAEGISVQVNGSDVPIASEPSSYVPIHREWQDGDTVEIEFSMHTVLERLPDGSDWTAILHGPILLAHPSGTEDLAGLRADDSRMGHVASGPLTPLDRVPVLIGSPAQVLASIESDPLAGPLHFRVKDVVPPEHPDGLPLVPFFRLHDSRYQMYWQLETAEGLAQRRKALAAIERSRATLQAATLDSVAVGEQQSEVEHDFAGEETETGLHQGRRWRHGKWFEYTLDTQGETAVDLVVTYWGGDSGRRFQILANGRLIAEETLTGTHPGEFFAKRYPLPTDVLHAASDGRISLRFVATHWLAGGVYDVRLLKSTEAVQYATNPVIWADVPDIAMIRVGDTYYMSSTTMHMSPGLPIMKSQDLVNWELVGYAYETLADNESLRLENGRNAYGAGSWASSLRFHDGTFYASTFSSTTNKTHIYTTKDIETGPWTETTFSPSLHDHTLFFDDDGRVYMIYGGGDIRLVELNDDVSGIKPGGVNRVIIPNASRVAGGRVGLPAEGSQMIKVHGKYYLFNITWPRGDMRTQIVHRADRIDGPYEGRVVLRDQGVAQGSIIDTPDGKWYAYLFQDHGAVGRVPFIVPMRWEDEWPVLGVAGKVPMTLDIPAGQGGLGNIVASDDFQRQPGDPAFPPAWQWNHNPDHQHWSLTQRPGWLRLTTGRIDPDFLSSRNTLTQRTFGSQCSAIARVDVSQMKDGDVAGLGALQRRYGFVGVKRTGNTQSIVMVSAEADRPEELESLPLERDIVYFRIDCDYRQRADIARFFYSLDGEQWTAIGRPLKMAYTLPHFMGYRFALFNFATREIGGFVDFDFFKVQEETPPLGAGP